MRPSSILMRTFKCFCKHPTKYKCIYKCMYVHMCRNHEYVRYTIRSRSGDFMIIQKCLKSWKVNKSVNKSGIPFYIEYMWIYIQHRIHINTFNEIRRSWVICQIRPDKCSKFIPCFNCIFHTFLYYFNWESNYALTGRFKRSEITFTH